MATFEGQLQLWKVMLGFVDSMVLGAAVELSIADAIHSKPLSLTELATQLNLPATEVPSLFRLLRLLTRKSIFSSTTDPDTNLTLYSSTPSSQWLLRSAKRTLAPLMLMRTAPHGPAPWQRLSECVVNGETPFELARGVDYKTFTDGDAKLSKTFIDAIACLDAVTFGAVLAAYGEGFKGVGTVVEVGGGGGKAAAEIVKLHPGVKGIGFGGDVFSEAIPQGDALFIKGLLHNFEDKQCAAILNNCRKSIPQKTGKLVIVEAVLYPEEQGALEDIKIAYDIVMFTNTRGKERTEEEWRKVLQLGGFPRCNFIRAQGLLHNFEDKQCAAILNNCRKSIPQKTGKLVIVEAVLYPEEQGPLEDIKIAYDIVMFTNTRGKEEWRKVLQLGGFPRCNFIRAQAITSIIEAFPM